MFMIRTKNESSNGQTSGSLPIDTMKPSLSLGLDTVLLQVSFCLVALIEARTVSFLRKFVEVKPKVFAMFLDYKSTSLKIAITFR